MTANDSEPASSGDELAAAAEPVAELTVTETEEQVLSPGRYALNLHSDMAPIEFMPELGSDDDARLLYVTETELDGDTWYRLRLGFFATEAEAQARLDDWLADYPNAWLVRVGPLERASAGPQAVAAASN
jgi:septal ring-binding cell division protein DamX